jgi:hypothetical protein
MTTNSYGELVYSKPRLFVVFRVSGASCLALPITSFQGRLVAHKHVSRSYGQKSPRHKGWTGVNKISVSRIDFAPVCTIQRPGKKFREQFATMIRNSNIASGPRPSVRSNSKVGVEICQGTRPVDRAAHALIPQGEDRSLTQCRHEED